MQYSPPWRWHLTDEGLRCGLKMRLIFPMIYGENFLHQPHSLFFGNLTPSLPTSLFSNLTLSFPISLFTNLIPISSATSLFTNLTLFSSATSLYLCQPDSSPTSFSSICQPDSLRTSLCQLHFLLFANRPLCQLHSNIYEPFLGGFDELNINTSILGVQSSRGSSAITSLFLSSFQQSLIVVSSQPKLQNFFLFIIMKRLPVDIRAPKLA